MKKLILSAVFALACFSAQVKNEVIKNDDDKNPKNKAKVVARIKKEVIPQKLACRATGTIWCSNGLGYRFDVSFESDNCSAGAVAVANGIANQVCSIGVIAR